MSKWIDLDLAERRVILQSVENKEKLQQAAAIEKDWWVTAVLKALFQTSCKEALSFKGGTSLSKGWGIIRPYWRMRPSGLSLHGVSMP